MIADAIMWVVQKIFDAFKAAVAAVLDLLPDLDPPDLTGMIDSIAPVFSNTLGYLGYLNKYIPVDQLALAIGVLVGSWVALYLFRFTVWCLTKAHILGGGDF